MSDTDTTTTVTQEPGPPPSVTIDRRSGAPWWVLPGLAAMILTIFGGALVASCFIGNDTLQTQMFTGAFGLATAAVAYFFGSSKGSQDKDATMAASTAKKDDTIQANSAALAVSTPAKGPLP